MSREEVASALDRAAEALAEAAHALRAIEPPAASAGVPDSLPAASAAGDVPAPAARPLQEQHVAAALGVCPVHRTAWTVKDAGVGKNGKPYKAFWKCSGKTDGVYCNEKPVKAWQDTHPITEEVPF
jgi:hypothetical protein